MAQMTSPTDMRNAEFLHEKMTACRIPSHMHEGLSEYILRGRPVGDFLTAVLSNDLKEACGRADDENKHRLYDYVFLLYNYCPAGCYGSPKAVKAWIEHQGLLFEERPQ